MIFIYNIYYRFYKLSTFFGETGIPWANSAIFFAFFQALNFLQISDLLFDLFNYPTLMGNKSRTELWFWVLLLFTINFLFLWTCNRRERIRKLFENESEKGKIIGWGFFSAYILVTIIMLIYTLNN